MYEHVWGRLRARVRAITIGASIALAWSVMFATPHAGPADQTQEVVRGTFAHVKVVRIGAGAHSAAARGAQPARSARPVRRAAATRAVAAGGRARPLTLCPVDGPRRWLPGDWRPRPYRRAVDGAGAPLRAHLGIDLFARRGTPVRAPLTGVIRFGRDPRGGKWFRLYAPKGYVYGSHMAAFARRSGRVRSGEIIGYVGNSGNARLTSPHLHFEWHPKRARKRPIDPEGFLRDRCGPPSRQMRA